ncbi:hypothetical protein [Negadavirga shengliensis]|uniref:Lipocalin-like domain-containing protein n=1 Tax=Negadavirga shengliensis TaxID=1389218 RepID=A0ABV9SYX1_9BACT
MKKIFLSSLLLLIFFMTACNRDADEFNPNFLHGSWEKSQFYADLEADYVETFVFSQDGSYEHKRSFRNPGTSEELGYSFFATGSFLLEDNLITLIYSRLLISVEEYYTDFEELVEIEEDSGMVTEARLKIKDSGSILIVYYPCNDMLSSSCLGAQTYRKTQ